MSGSFLLHHHLINAATRFPEKTAAVFGDQSLSYRELDKMTNQVAELLESNGIGVGDRVGIYVSKSLASIVSIFGILKSGAAYVPLDPGAPLQRLAYIIEDSKITSLLTSSAKLSNLEAMFPNDSPLSTVALIDCDAQNNVSNSQHAGNTKWKVIDWNTITSLPADESRKDAAIETDTAYILYTSGSTGTPKGVMISHRNSLTFVDAAAEIVGLTSEDRVSSHAPIHFDLSTFDIFSSCKAGAATILVPETASTFPVNLVKLIERERITTWYSVPSVLSLMVIYGSLSAHDLSSLRMIIFAGEVFPAKYLQKLITLLPKVRYLNWYGPTETNVCTWYEVLQRDQERITPVPIGKPWPNIDVFAVNDAGEKVGKLGDTGELYVRGPSVMQGYWNDPQKTAKVLLENPFNNKSRELVYKTGDIVSLDSDGNYVYLGRRDGMIKTRGYRVELGEIESVLYTHHGIKEVAVLAVPDELIGSRLHLVVSPVDGSLKREEVLAYCNQRLPHYMVPESVEFLETLPKTSTGKIDRVALAKSFSK